MKPVVFLGPTLGAREAATHLSADYRSPARQGDLYRAARDGAPAIGLVDGYFNRVPAVWHKEVLWALSQGVSVYGSASMGALRAAELAPFGMVGVGAIFEACYRGELEDDDEVALAHGPEEMSYRAVSEPMVNLRATLAVAVGERVVGQRTAEALLGAAKALFYAERSLAAMIERGRTAGLPPGELESLVTWWPRGYVDAKRCDAIAMLDRMRDDGPPGWKRERDPAGFTRTDAWETFCAVTRSDDEARDAAAPRAEDIETLVQDELILFAPHAYIRATRKLEALAQDTAKATPNDLRLALEWYFVECLGRTIPDDLDAYARETGMRDGGALSHAVWRDRLYVSRWG